LKYFISSLIKTPRSS